MRFVDRSLIKKPRAMLPRKTTVSAADQELIDFTAYFEEKAAALEAALVADDPVAAAASVTKEFSAKKPTFNTYRKDSVKTQLYAIFHGKCAYCETFYPAVAPVDVEHYRPKGAVGQDATHPGYWWLAMAWENLLPSCIHCNRLNKHATPKLSTQLVELLADGTGFSDQHKATTGKGNHFPILGLRATPASRDCSTEYPLLLNPCLDDPQEHLAFHVDREKLIGLVLPKPHDGAGLPTHVSTRDLLPEFADEIDQALREKLSLRGAVSIHTYGLNRLGLVQDRTRVLRQLAFLEESVRDLCATIQSLEARLNDPFAVENKRIITRMEALVERTAQHMADMAKPQAPYSTMVYEFLQGFQTRLLAVP
ncbi:MULTISPECIES: endonuclease [unclassified Pseudomonas]|uniref:endonuclease n=1 Tax=unclassified Pseudomonas TaxID=196821 RepID=UPI002A365EDA|nr:MULTISPECIES: endonuclease [unclassified Pseudomonas]MDX9669008.1 endonuclease [Pseudomonas sp. P8_250]WPN36941.1 endonuclease [Pseudomonas sp. P8_139]WPN41258.1 endonuclease [Pseudomonas sp. P8_229]